MKLAFTPDDIREIIAMSQGLNPEIIDLHESIMALDIAATANVKVFRKKKKSAPKITQERLFATIEEGVK